MKVKSRTNLDAVFAKLDDAFQRRLPLALAIAMTKTAVDVKAAIIDEMKQVFDRPTPYTLRTVLSEKATPSKPTARVWLDDDPIGAGVHTRAEYLAVQIGGGVRIEKRSEWILRRAKILPAGMSAVPGKFVPRDAYGNISSGLIVQLISALRVSLTGANRPISGTSSIGSSIARKARARARQGDFFVASRSSVHGRHLQPGIYRRIAGAIMPILVFVPTPRYRGILDFEGVAERTADAVLPEHLREQIAITLAKIA